MAVQVIRTLFAAGIALAACPSTLQADAQSELVKRAEHLLTVPISTVMDKELTAPSGDKHDYYAPAPYHWPNPNTADGLPYVLRDGQVNPDANTPKYDRVSYFRMGDAVTTLSVAYALAGDKRLAARAGDWLRAWFVADATRMNSNLEYAQCVPGRTQGLAIGLIRGTTLLDVARSARLLAASDGWTDGDQSAVDRWLGDYRRWLSDSQLGREESRAANNHGTWYDAQRAVLALYMGDRDSARSVVESARDTRLARQIAPDGRQPLEVLRTKSWDYSVMNLEAWVVLADVGRQVGVDLWGRQTEDGRGIVRVIDYLQPFALGRQAWPPKDLTPFEPRALVPSLRRAVIAHAGEQYQAAVETLGDDVQSLLRTRLLAVPLATSP